MFCKLDGVTSGPNSFSGKIGKDISQDVWREPIVAYPTVAGKMPVLSEEQLSDTSRDQYLVYHLGHSLQSGIVPDKIASATIGPLLHARWLTTVARILRKALSTRRPTKTFSRICFFIVNVYLPSWFHIKNKPHCQSGALHLFNMLQLSRELDSRMKDIMTKVLQENSYFAHPENIIIACLADSRVKIREKAVTYILTARDMFDNEIHPRKFLPPRLILEATDNVDMINWETKQKAEPPLMMKLSREEIIGAMKQPLILPKYPCHTQNVEKTV